MNERMNNQLTFAPILTRAAAAETTSDPSS